MSIVLGTTAAIICLVYSIYFVRIIRGAPEDFELELLKVMADWMIGKGASSRNYVWGMFIFTVAFETVYFVMVLNLIDNLAMQFLTGFMVGVEIFHLIAAAFNFNRFFKGKIVLKDIFNWHLERTSAILFFTHSMLVMVVLTLF